MGDKRSLFDVLGNCRLQMMELGFEEEYYAELYSIITGRKKSWQELLNISERIWHLTRAFSAREIDSFGRHRDWAPARLYEDPIADGPNQGHALSREDIDNLLSWYYESRGWNQNGIPTRETLRAVGLAEVAEDLEAKGLISGSGVYNCEYRIMNVEYRRNEFYLIYKKIEQRETTLRHSKFCGSLFNF